MRQLALRCVLSAKAGEGELKVLEQFNFDKPRTKDMVSILTALGVESSAMVVTAGLDSNVIKSSRNLPGIKTTPANLLNVVDLLSYKVLLMTVAAVREVEQLWGNGLSEGESDASVRSIATSTNN